MADDARGSATGPSEQISERRPEAPVASAASVMEAFARDASSLTTEQDSIDFAEMGGVDQLLRLAQPPNAGTAAATIELQQRAIAALAVVCAASSQAADRLRHIGGLGTVLAIARNEREDTNVNRGASLLMVHLCGSSDTCRRFLRMGGLGLAAKKLRDFVQSSDNVTDNYLWLLTNTINFEELRPDVEEHRHVVEALVAVLQHTPNFHILSHALTLLTALASDENEYGACVLRRQTLEKVAAVGGKAALARAAEHLGPHLSSKTLQLCRWFADNVESRPICGRGGLLAFYRPSPGRTGQLTALDIEVQAHYLRSLSSLGLELAAGSSFDLQLSSNEAVRKIRAFFNSARWGADDLLVLFYAGKGDAYTGDWNDFSDEGATVALQEVLRIWSGCAAQRRGAMLFIVSDSSGSTQLVAQAEGIQPRSVVLQCAETIDDRVAGNGDGGNDAVPATEALLRRSGFLLQWLAGIAARKIPSKILFDMAQKSIRPTCYWPKDFPATPRLIKVTDDDLEIPVLGPAPMDAIER